MPATRRRTATKLLRLHPEELAHITARAEASDRPAACFIPGTALGAIPRPRHDAAADPLLCELAPIGRCLDQSACLVRARHHAALAERVRRASNTHRGLVRQVVQDRRRRAGAPAR